MFAKELQVITAVWRNAGGRRLRLPYSFIYVCSTADTKSVETPALRPSCETLAVIINDSMKILGIILTILVLSSSKLIGCDCVSKELKQHVEESSHILVAKVVKQEITWIKSNHLSFEENPDTSICSYDINGIRRDSYNYCMPVTVFTLKIKRQFKGEIRTMTIEVYSPYSSNCYENLITGFDYIFYLNQTDKTDIYNRSFFSYISQCSRIEMTNNYVINSQNQRVSELDYLESLKIK